MKPIDTAGMCKSVTREHSEMAGQVKCQQRIREQSTAEHSLLSVEDFLVEVEHGIIGRLSESQH